MEPTNYTRIIILLLMVTAWCVLHSAMISLTATEFLKKLLGPRFRFYRLFFNLLATLTFIPVVLVAFSARTQVIFHWNGYMRIGQMLLIATAMLLFFLGGRQYDARQFLGIKQIRRKNPNRVISDSGEFETGGVLGITRHPWYLAAIFLIWARQLDLSAIAVNVILTSYLIIGSYLEEKKLIREFGEKYLTYQKRVSMLIPYKWLKFRVLGWPDPPK